MAVHTCQSCGELFVRNVKGRPPKQCDNCRAAGVKVPKQWTPATLEPSVWADTTTTSATVDPFAGSQSPTQEVAGKPNKYGADCWICDTWVVSGDGIASKNPATNKWQVRHSSCVPAGTNDPGIDLEPSDVASKPTDSLVADRDPASSTSALGSLESAMLDLIKANMPKIDESTVRNVVSDAISSFVSSELPKAIQSAGVVRHEYVINDEVRTPTGLANKVLPDLMAVLTAGRPGERIYPCLYGPAGTGKSYLAQQAAETLGKEFGVISFGPMTSTSKLFGYMDANGNYVGTPFRWIWEHGGIMLFDEMDNAHPGLLAELNMALAGNVAAFADQMVKKHDEFIAIGATNTLGLGPDKAYNARNKLDGATRTRFVWLKVDYDETLERQMALAWVNDVTATETAVNRWVDVVQGCRRVASKNSWGYLFTPRHTKHGAMLMANGMGLDQVREMVLMPEVDATHRRTLVAV